MSLWGMTAQAEELRLYAENTYELYAERCTIVAHMQAGLSERVAIRKWRAWFDFAADCYQSEIERKRFSISARNEAARQMYADECNAIANGEYDWLKGRIDAGTN